MTILESTRRDAVAEDVTPTIADVLCRWFAWLPGFRIGDALCSRSDAATHLVLTLPFIRCNDAETGCRVFFCQRAI